MLSAAIGMKDCESQGESWLAIGTVRDRQGDHKSALECAEKALALAQENDCTIEIAEAVLLKGQSHYRLGDAKEAGIYIQDALEHGQKDAEPIYSFPLFESDGVDPG